jgi:hypothetical protein
MTQSSGFDEAWLAQHQARMAALRADVASHQNAVPRAKLPGRGRAFVWTSEDDDRLRQDYAAYVTDGRRTLLAAEMGVSPLLLCRKARALGLTDQRRHKSFGQPSRLKGQEADFTKVQGTASDKTLGGMFGVSAFTVRNWWAALGLSKDRHLVWKHTPHPRGATGLVHTDETKRQQSARSKANWADPDAIFNSEAFRQAKSDRMSARMAGHRNERVYSRGKAGRRADLNDQFFRSSWEANYARYLNFLISNGKIYRWEYEADTFWFEAIKRGTRSYTPDFKIWTRADSDPYYVEIKGWMDQKSRTRAARMKKYYPGVRIVLVEAPQYRAIARTIGGVLSAWEQERGGKMWSDLLV